MSNVVQCTILSVFASNTVQNIERSTGMGLTFCIIMLLLMSGISLAEDDLGKDYINDARDLDPECQPSSWRGESTTPAPAPPWRPCAVTARPGAGELSLVESWSRDLSTHLWLVQPPRPPRREGQPHPGRPRHLRRLLLRHLLHHLLRYKYFLSTPNIFSRLHPPGGSWLPSHRLARPRTWHSSWTSPSGLVVLGGAAAGAGTSSELLSATSGDTEPHFPLKHETLSVTSHSS